MDISEIKKEKNRLRTILRVEEIRMQDLKTGDKFFVMEDGAFLYEGRMCRAESNGSFDIEKDAGIVEAHVI